MVSFSPAVESTRRFAIGKREVLVFDDLFSAKTRRLLYQQFRNTQFHWGARDSLHPTQAHAVRWSRPIATQATSLPFFAEVAALIGRITQPRLVLDRIYINFNLFGEMHFPHVDAPTGVTALYCANVAWKPEWQGETFFYDGNEPTHVVLPRPGRLMVFDASLRHRGSQPARDCYEPRINIAFKFQPRHAPRPTSSKRVAVVRRA